MLGLKLGLSDRMCSPKLFAQTCSYPDGSSTTSCRCGSRNASTPPNGPTAVGREAIVNSLAFIPVVQILLPNLASGAGQNFADLSDVMDLLDLPLGKVLHN